MTTKIIMNSLLDKVNSYPFAKLRNLLNVEKNADLKAINLSIGEPKHKPLQSAIDEYIKHIDKFAVYPTIKGIPQLRQTIANWLSDRFKIDNSLFDIENQILPVCGTREALFSFVQAAFDKEKTNKSLVLMPNPFYQIYEGATYLAGGKPYYLPCTISGQPDYANIPNEIWQQAQIVMLCSPHNPTGAVLDLATLKLIMQKAKEFDFYVASDECYSEIYFNEAPKSLLNACVDLGFNDFENAIIFHSLSKRSNLPGLRSGFVCGDKRIMEKFNLYRTYHGSTMNLPTQYASIKAWEDESHTIENRKLYSEKFSKVVEILKDVLEVKIPDASFYLYVKTPFDSEKWTQELFKQQAITVLPAKYLSKEIDGVNPGERYIRIALVASVEDCIEAANRIKNFVATNIKNK